MGSVTLTAREVADLAAALEAARRSERRDVPPVEAVARILPACASRLQRLTSGYIRLADVAGQGPERELTFVLAHGISLHGVENLLALMILGEEAKAEDIASDIVASLDYAQALHCPSLRPSWR